MEENTHDKFHSQTSDTFDSKLLVNLRLEIDKVWDGETSKRTVDDIIKAKVLSLKEVGSLK